MPPRARRCVDKLLNFKCYVWTMEIDEVMRVTVGDGLTRGGDGNVGDRFDLDSLFADARR